MHQLYRTVVADVVDPVRGTTGAGVGSIAIPVEIRLGQVMHDPVNSLDDIVDEGEIPLHFTVVEDIDRFPLKDRLGEEEQRHVRSSPRAVDGEEPEPGGGQAVEVGVSMGHQFVRLLRGGVEGDGMIDVVVDGKGHLRVCAVDGA